MGVSLIILSKYFVIYGLGGCRVLIGILKNFGLVWVCFWSFSLVLSSLSSQSEDIANFSGQSLPSGLYIAQYFECSVISIVAAGEVGEGVDGVLIT